jgi:cytochrome P450
VASGAAAPLTAATPHEIHVGMNSAESAGGRLGAVLSVPRDGMVQLGRHGPWLATTPALVRRVLTDPACFDFPSDVSRSADLSGSTGESRSGHTIYPPLSSEQVARGATTFEEEWHAAVTAHERTAGSAPYDAMVVLRRPVARSTTAAVLSGLAPAERNTIGDLTLSWIDALGPVIASRRPPARWSRLRKRELRARRALEDALGRVPGLDQPGQVATMLAAGIQVPIAAGAFLLAWIAQHETRDIDPVNATWETLRLTPPTWITARITTREVDLDGTSIPPGRVVFVSPLLLGRSSDLVPGDSETLPRFEPDRWLDQTTRPGAWLPFGAGPHACPGRSLGTVQLVTLARWALAQGITLSEEVSIDQSRGIFPSPCRFTLAARREASP